jgi:hypothetical protein
MTAERTSDMDQHDLRGRVVGLEHGAAHKETRIVALEQWRAQTDITNAVRDEQYRGIKEDLKSIKGIVSRLAWLMVTGIAMGFIAFIVNGGLKVP